MYGVIREDIILFVRGCIFEIHIVELSRDVDRNVIKKEKK